MFSTIPENYAGNCSGIKWSSPAEKQGQKGTMYVKNKKTTLPEKIRPL
jgi:hypothetical protein